MPENVGDSNAGKPETSTPQPPGRLCEVVRPPARRMSKESRVRLVTIAVIAAAAAVVIGGRAGWRLPSPVTLGPAAPQTASRPQDVIYRMLDAAGQGDADAYLACYSGAMRRRLEQSRDEMTAGGFARYLVENNRRIKGIAISDPETLSGTSVQVRVEFVYEDRNEAQQFFLEQSASGWTIARVSAAERVETPMPYGAPVY